MTTLTRSAAAAGIGASLIASPGMFRLLLAAAVVVSHISRFNIGRLAVLLFFYLSGYWTARVWVEKFNSGSTLRFYAARFLRIAPLYALAVAAGLAVVPQSLHLENFTIVGLATTHRDPIGDVAWSLDIELQYYLILPFVVALLGRAKAWVWALLAVVIGVLGCWIETRFGLVTVAKYLPAFVFGALTFSERWKPSVKAANLSLAAFLAMTALTALTPFFDKRQAAPFDNDIWAFFWMIPLLPYVARSLCLRSSTLDRHLGNLSYPLYLAHCVTITAFTQLFGATSGVRYVGALAALLIAIAVYVVIDRRVDPLRVRLTETPRPAFA